MKLPCTNISGTLIEVTTYIATRYFIPPANREEQVSIILAIDLFENRKLYKELTKNPLQRHEIDRTGGE